MVWIDDASTDGGSDLIPDLPHFVKRVNPLRLTVLESLHLPLLSQHLEDRDIVVIVDGDDYLLDDRVLRFVGAKRSLW